MKSKNVIYTLLVLLAMLALAVLKLRHEPRRREAFDRTAGPLVYTPYARCTMQCSRISQQDIQTVMRNGIIHLNESGRRSFPCRTFALQGRPPGGRYLRIFFEQCTRSTRVVACYDLESKTDCNCNANHAYS